MKATINVSRILVGVLFIFSGLVKANDPLSLGYKMQEFFEIWNDELAKGTFFLNHSLINVFNFFHEHSLALAIVMIAFEIIAGAALLLGWKMKLFGWLLLLLIIFFTFLTGYALLSGKFKNCGCFGDCLPISPKTSFLKDLFLLVLISFLFTQRKKINPLFSARATALWMLVVTILSFGIQWYMLTYLPLADCLPYKKGNNISEKMKLPADAIPDSTVISFVYLKDGTLFKFPADSVPKNLNNKEYLFVKQEDDSLKKIAVYIKGGKKIEFTADKFPDDFNSTTYTLISRYDKVVRKGKNNEPLIKGFSLSGITNEDSTQIVLDQVYAILLFCEDFSVPVSKWKDSFSKLYAVAKEKNIPAYLVTTQPAEAAKAVSGTSFADIQIFKCDYTAIRTAARTNPCIYLLEKGTILGKWSYHKTGGAIKKTESLVVKRNQSEIPKDSLPAPLDTSKIK
jgi:uncharacterized membrane protein YphA (DoxX/SURF4 family)